ncbi:MAG: prolipoprotein diacylglyceryl transferase [Candidatus Margulisiibacteriota bacterium]
MYPILFKIGPLSVHAYGFAIAIAFLIGILISLHYAKKEGIKREAILDLSIYIIIAAILGSRFLYVVGEWEQYKENLMEIFMVQRGGLVFLGGLLLAMLVVVWYARRKGIPLLKLLDVLAPGTALGYAITRIGCFFNGCCFGLPTKVPWAMVFPSGSLAGFYFPGKPVHPTQLYAVASMLLVFLIVVVLYRRKKFEGQIFFWWLILYSIYRFLVEFLRYSPIHWLGLTPSQWMVLPMAALAIYGLIFNLKRLKA